MLWCQCGIWPPQTWSHTCHGVPNHIPHRLASQVDKQACLCPNMHMEVWAPHGRALGCPNTRWATTFHHLGMKLRGQKPVCSSQNLHQFHVSNICGCRGTKSSSLGLQPVVVLKSAQKWQLGPSTTFYHLRMRLWEQKPLYSSQNSAPVSCVKHLWCPKLA